MNRTEHLLSIVSEESHETGQRATKAQRFSLQEIQPGQPYTNAERIMHEFADLTGVIEMLIKEGHITNNERDFRGRVQAKKIRVEEYLKHSKECGTLQE